MSYDTTVHDAIDPPRPRMAKPGEGGDGGPVLRGRLRSLGRAILLTLLSLAVVAMVTLVVASFTPMATGNPEYSPDATTAEARP